jgi:hypothetical protein
MSYITSFANNRTYSNNTAVMRIFNEDPSDIDILVKVFDSNSVSNVIRLYSPTALRLSFASTSTIPISRSVEAPTEEWAQEVISNSKKSERKVILGHYEKIYPALFSEKFSNIDYILGRLEVEDCPDLFLVGLLRITAPWKEKLVYWEYLLEVVKQKFNCHGLKTESILSGLL